MSLVSRPNGDDLSLRLVANACVMVTTLSIQLVIPGVLHLSVHHLIRWTTPVILYKFSIIRLISSILLKLPSWCLLTKSFRRISITWLFGFAQRPYVSYHLYLVMRAITSAIVSWVDSAGTFLRLGEKALAADTHHTLLAVFVWSWRKVTISVYVLRLLAFLLNCSDFTVVARLFKHDFAGGDLGLLVSLLYLLDPFPGVKRSAHVNYFVSFSKVSLVTILVNFSLSNTWRKLLVIVSCIIFLFLSKFINTSISSIGMRFHLYHLAYFWSVDGLRNVLGLLHVMGLL